MATEDDTLDQMLDEIAANPRRFDLHQIAADAAQDAGKPQTEAALRHMAEHRRAPAMRSATGPNFDSGTMAFVWDSPWDERGTNTRGSHIIPRDVFDYMPAHAENYRVPHNEFHHGWTNNRDASAAYAGDMGVNNGRFHRAEYATARQALNAYLLGHAHMVQNRADEESGEKAYTDLLLEG